MKKTKIITTILLIIFIIIIGLVIFKNDFSNNGKLYKEVTVEEFENIATENGYYFIDDSYNENLDENEMPEEISDFSVGFSVDEDNAFQNIKSGIKKFELRLYDEKRKIINIGDTIIFHNLNNLEDTITVKVLALLRYPTFADFF